jgi:hypothetical protein
MIMRGGVRRRARARALFASALYFSSCTQLLFEKSRGNNFCSSVAQSSGFIIMRTRAVIISDVLPLIVANFCISPRAKDRARARMCVWPGGWPSGRVVTEAGKAGGGYAPSPPLAAVLLARAREGIYHKM